MMQQRKASTPLTLPRFIRVVASMFVSVVSPWLLMPGATAGSPQPFEVTPYEVTKVTEGGVLTGKVTFSGPLPEDAVEHIQITKNNDTCGNTREILWIDVKDKALRGTFVYLEEIAVGKTWPETDNEFVLEQKGCRFQPWAQVVKPGHITIRNSDDGLLHNVHTSELIGIDKAVPVRRTVFKFGQPNPGDIIERLLPARSPHLAVNCEVHNFMFGWLMAPSHPWKSVV